MPITHVSRRPGTKTSEKLVDILDDTSPRFTQTSPTTPDDKVQRAASGLQSVVSRGNVIPLPPPDQEQVEWVAETAAVPAWSRRRQIALSLQSATIERKP